jgi:hypothetical protein
MRSEFPLVPKRRRFLKTGLIGASLLAIGGGAMVLLADPAKDQRLVLTAVVTAMLDGSVKPQSAQFAETLAACNQAISGLSPAAQNELKQLFGLLASSPGRWLTGLNPSWETADVKSVSEWLTGLRFHRIGLLQSAYHAFHDIVLGSHFGNEKTWTAIGYGGPINL